MTKAPAKDEFIDEVEIAPVAAQPSADIMAQALAMILARMPEGALVDKAVQAPPPPAGPVKKIWVTLEENPSISRTGQFFGVNGMTYMLKPGVKAAVPEAIVDVLDAAIELVSITDPDTLKVIEVRPRKRYPYTVHGPVTA